MNLAILLAVAVWGWGGSSGSAAEECSGHYRVPSGAGQVLKAGVDIPCQLALDTNNNTLVFSYSTHDEKKPYQSMYIDLKDNTSGNIAGVTGGFAHAYDSQHQILYIGGADGIYRFKYDTKFGVKLDISLNNIWQMFYKDGLFYSVYPDETTFVYKDGHLERVKELQKTKARMIAVDKDGSIYFKHGDSELKRVKDGVFSDIGNYNVNGFNTDLNGQLYFSTKTAIYKVNGAVVRKWASFRNIYGFVVEGEHQVVYGAASSVVRVTLTPDMCVDDKELEDETSNDV